MLSIWSHPNFFHCVFERLVVQSYENQGLFGKGLKKKNVQTKTLKFCLMFCDYRDSAEPRRYWNTRHCDNCTTALYSGTETGSKVLLPFLLCVLHIYTPTKRMFSGVYGNQPFCPSVCPSTHVICLCTNTSVCQSAGGGGV